MSTDPQRWSLAGWSTGGFCAAKLLLHHRSLFRAVVGVGAYYDAETDKATGNLFGDSQQLRNAYSPLWLVQHQPRRTTHLLVVGSRTDRSSWSGKFSADSKAMIIATDGIPGVSTLVLSSGGHNYRVYQPTFPRVLSWLGRKAGL